MATILGLAPGTVKSLARLDDPAPPADHFTTVHTDPAGLPTGCARLSFGSAHVQA